MKSVMPVPIRWISAPTGTGIGSVKNSGTLRSPAREDRLRDPAVRDRMRAELAEPAGRSFVFTWDSLRVESVARAEHEGFVGRSVQEIADERGADAFDAFLDLSLTEDLETQFVRATPPSEARRAATETMIKSDVTMAGSSDGGAHVESFCGADFTTRLLAEWVPATLTLEAAVARVTSRAAAACGIRDRGVLAVGSPADINVIDREHLAAADAPRYVRDFPAGSGRYVVDARGYVATIVNGEVLLDDGRWTGATPGRILRGGVG